MEARANEEHHYLDEEKQFKEGLVERKTNITKIR